MKSRKCLYCDSEIITAESIRTVILALAEIRVLAVLSKAVNLVIAVMAGGMKGMESYHFIDDSAERSMMLSTVVHSLSVENVIRLWKLRKYSMLTKKNMATSVKIVVVMYLPLGHNSIAGKVNSMASGSRWDMNVTG